jgi:hypothetical protein
MFTYEVKVRDKIYLWGSSGITTDNDSSVILFLRNDVFGDSIDIGTETAGGAADKLGTLQPGECYTISLHGHSGVYAHCLTDTSVMCSLALPMA